MIIPFRVTFGQDVAVDTTQQGVDLKYDSVMAIAAKSFSDSSYEKAIAHYREAAKLKPQETYPDKMIMYVEATSREAAAKQKRERELSEKAQIKDDLLKANQAIADKNWASAKSLFNEILTLHPQKGDEDFAKSKIQAIDLELQRIAAKIPVKEEPKPVYVPETKPKVSYRILQHFNEDFKDVSNITWTLSSDYAKADFIQDEEKVEAFYDPDGVLIGTSRHISTSELPRDARRIFATKYSQDNIKEVIRYEGANEAAYYISTESDREKTVFKLTGSKDIAVFSKEVLDKNTLAAGLNKAAPPKLNAVATPGNLAAGASLQKQVRVTVPPAT